MSKLTFSQFPLWAISVKVCTKFNYKRILAVHVSTALTCFLYQITGASLHILLHDMLNLQITKIQFLTVLFWLNRNNLEQLNTYFCIFSGKSDFLKYLAELTGGYSHPIFCGSFEHSNLLVKILNKIVHIGLKLTKQEKIYVVHVMLIKTLQLLYQHENFNLL